MHNCKPVMHFVVLVLTAGLLPFAYGQTPSREQTASGSVTGAYDLQRSIRIERYNVAGTNGPARGETLYYYKCWMCHNQYTQSAPPLKDLYQRPRLLSGEPVNDGTVASQIQTDGPKLPKADRLAFLRAMIGVLDKNQDGKLNDDEVNPAVEMALPFMRGFGQIGFD